MLIVQGGAGNWLLHMNRNNDAELYLSNHVASVLIGSYERFSLSIGGCECTTIVMMAMCRCAHTIHINGTDLWVEPLTFIEQNRPA
jgi:hypothetical protein